MFYYNVFKGRKPWIKILAVTIRKSGCRRRQIPFIDGYSVLVFLKLFWRNIQDHYEF
jgi:hypothetical protein